MNKQQRDAARKRCEKASAALDESGIHGFKNIDPDLGDSWDVCFYAAGPHHRAKYVAGASYEDNPARKQAKLDSEFFAHARADLPAALEDIDALVKELRKCSDALTAIDGNPAVRKKINDARALLARIDGDAP